MALPSWMSCQLRREWKVWLVCATQFEKQILDNEKKKKKRNGKGSQPMNREKEESQVPNVKLL